MDPCAREQVGSLEPRSTVRRRGSSRYAHFLSLLPTTNAAEIVSSSESTSARVIEESLLCEEVSGWLAWYHLVHPEYHILPGVADRLSNCDIDFSLRLYDTEASVLKAAGQLSELFFSPPPDSQEAHVDLLPVAVLGETYSAVTSVLSVLSSSYGLPQISASSTSASLDNKEIHPLFARTAPTNAGDAQAIVDFYHYLGVSHFAVLYFADEFGTNYHAGILEAANRRGLTVRSIGYNEKGIPQAVKQLRDLNLQYVVGIMHNAYWRPLVREAARVGLMGPNSDAGNNETAKVYNGTGMAWMLTESNTEIVGEGFRLDRNLDGDIASALHGAALLQLHLDPYEPFIRSLKEFASSPWMQQTYISQHANVEVFANYSFPLPGPTLYSYLTYDAVTALGIAACEVDSDLFTGKELYDQLRETQFIGVSGPVSFDNLTGTRKSSGLQYSVQNLLLSPQRSDDKYHRFSADISFIVDLANSETQDLVLIVNPFIFADGSTTPPAPLPPVQVNMNLIPNGTRVGGWIISSFVMLLSLAWMQWTWRHRRSDIVRASQPIFLFQLCIGTFLMASTIVPMSLQEPVSKTGLDVACQTTPWLLSIGFVTAWSALFAKTWRLNRLLQSGQTLKRVKIGPVDVMRPFFAMMVLNIALLTGWTLVTPLEWARVEVPNFDEYGRSIETYGTCKSSGSNAALWGFLGPILGINLVALIVTFGQCYQARNLPVEYSEAQSLGTSMGFLLETLVVGAPLLFVASENPSTQFLIRSVLLCIACLAILLPVFFPKYAQRRVIEQERSLRAASILDAKNSIDFSRTSLGGLAHHGPNKAAVPSILARGSATISGVYDAGTTARTTSYGPTHVGSAKSGIALHGSGPMSRDNDEHTLSEGDDYKGDWRRHGQHATGESRVARSSTYFTQLAVQRLSLRPGGSSS
jgi:ABC-type branched-subunit amino acid transport system substrate-binding protein